MSLKLSDTSVIFESDGKTVLVCDSFEFNELIITGDSNSTLPVNYIRDYFGYTQGSNNGYAVGGYAGSPYVVNDISKFPIANDGNETDIGSLGFSLGGAAGTYSKTTGFVSGGYSPPYRNNIQSFPFADETTNTTDVADLTGAKANVSGHSSSTHGYTSGGLMPASPYISDVIDKFSFSSTSNATDVGDLTVGRKNAAGHESTSHGYLSGGATQPATPTAFAMNVIDKFPFSSDDNATDVGDLTQARGVVSGQSSFTAGYTSGGQTDGTGTGPKNTIEKFPFSADGNASDVADLSYARKGGTGVSSTSHGFTASGFTGLIHNQVIDKFNFAADTNAALTGYLITGKNDAAGVQS